MNRADSVMVSEGPPPCLRDFQNVLHTACPPRHAPLTLFRPATGIDKASTKIMEISIYPFLFVFFG